MQEQQIIGNNSKKKKKWVYIIFVMMIVIQLGSIIYCFQFKKEGWHSDEMWSYGYANSYYQKDIYIDKDGNLINYGEWVDGSVLWDYLVVNEGEQFEYGSIYQNQINDLSPPLHSMILHTICSFFPETFSLWYSFVINIAAFIVCMIYLFKTARLLKGDWFALCCCAVYGFSLGARDTFIYLRMYAMCTALVMVILYNLLAYMRLSGEKKIFNKNLIAIAVTAFIGFLTNYYMIAFMGILTFWVCVYYLFQKKIKQMLVFGSCQLLMLMLSIGVFPALLNMTQSHNMHVSAKTEAAMNYNFEMRFRILSNFVTWKLFDIPVSLYPSGSLGRILVCGVVGIIWLIPLFYLLRDTTFVKKMLRRGTFLIRKFGAIVKWLFRRVNWYYVILVALVLCQIIVVGETSDVYGMKDYEDRYLMYLYPVVLIVGMALLYQIIIILFKRGRYGKRVVIAVSVLLVCMNLYNRTIYTEYMFKEFVKGTNLEECVEGMSCIYIDITNWLLTAMAPILMNSDQFFYCSLADYKNYEDEYRKKSEQGKVLLIIDKEFLANPVEEYESAYNIVNESEDSGIEVEMYEKMLDFFEDIEPDSEMEWISTQIVFGRPMETYIINP